MISPVTAIAQMIVCRRNRLPGVAHTYAQRPDAQKLPIANRNGGRHCCQPPLRRAKDMPVFATWSTSTFRPSLTRSRSWLTSSGVAFHRTAPSFEEPDRSTRLRGPKVRWSFDLSGPASGTEVPRSQNRPVFRGPSWVAPSRVPLRSPTIRRPPGAASRSRKTTLPAPLPGWPRQEPEGSSQCLPAEIGPLVTCRFLLPLPASGEAGTAVPITQAPCTPVPSRESEKCGVDPVDNGDIGHNQGNLSGFPESGACRLPFRSPPLTSEPCPNPLPSPTDPLTCAG
jgi:hypothetical protein